MTVAAGDDRSVAIRRSPEADWPAWFVVLLVFLTYSAVCRPVPSVNEPHYLTKAKHEWQPTWCDGDFFLESSSPHLVFYRTVGVLTQWLTLPQTAWAGRLIALALLAWGWTRLTSRVSDARWIAAGSACWFLLLQSLGNFSGEWLVGGVESKVFAYGLAFAGWASLMDGRPVAAGSGLGLAVSFHPVVGGWCVIATALAILRGFWCGRRSEDRRAPIAAREWTRGLLLLCVTALPGLIPAVQSLMGDDPESAAAADRFQVGTRLAHHLDPLAFPLSSYGYYGALIVACLVLQRRRAAGSGGRLFLRIVAASVVIAGVGFLVALGPRPIQQMPLAGLRIWLLKFYPFRLADLLVPMLLAMLVFESVSRWSRTGVSRWRRWGSGLLAVVAFGVALWMPSLDKNASRMSESQRRDWQAACEWLRRDSPPDALVYAANERWALKWFAHRPEYVNYKDCPQDAAGILEWARRLTIVNRWERAAMSDGHVGADELQELHEQTGITHLLVSRLGPIEGTPEYANDSFRVYVLGE